REDLGVAFAPGPGNVTNVPAGIAAQEIWTRRVMLQRLVRLYEQQLSSTAELESTKARKIEITREAQSWTRFAEPRPYSIHLTDRIREDLRAERFKVTNGESAVSTLEQLVEENRKALAQ